MLYNGTSRPELIKYTAEKLQTTLTYSFRLYSQNVIFESEAYASLILKIGTVPSEPGKPIDVATDNDAGTIDIVWQKPEVDGGWPVTFFEIWVDDGAGTWPDDPISVDTSPLDMDNLLF